MVLVKSCKLSAVCLLLTVVCPSVLCRDGADYRRARDILINSSDQLEERNLMEQFVSFMRHFNRVYSSPDELMQRLIYFKKFLDTVDRSRRANKGTATFGITKFADYSDRELQNLSGFQIDSTLLKQLLEQAKNTEDAHYDVPDSFDWRTKNVVTSVKDQGTCGACWAFSTIGCIESRHAIKKNKLIDLSEQQLLDCDHKEHACHGGLMNRAFEYIQTAGGIQPDANYPYVAHVNPGEDQHCDISEVDQKSLVKVLSHRRMRGGENAIKAELVKNGPVTAALNDQMLHPYNNETIDVDEDDCDPKHINHAVLIVGYGTEHNEDNGEAISYWIVKNSWGPRWGDKGYFKIRTGKNVCGIETYIAVANTN